MSLTSLRHRIEGWAGITLDRGRRLDLLDAAVAERVRALGLGSTDEYCSRVREPSDPEVERLINALTVTYTWFFRDLSQMQALQSLLAHNWPTGRPLHVWVTACATGEEAYSIAMMARAVGRPVQVVATDINSEALAHAERGWYGRWAVRDVPEAVARDALERHGDRYLVCDAVRDMVRFQRHNLMNTPLAASGPHGWDLIICRNVLIYFPQRVAVETLHRLDGVLDREGWLLLGGNEVVVELPRDLELVPLGDGKALRRAVAQDAAPQTQSASVPVRRQAASPKVSVAAASAGPKLQPAPQRVPVGGAPVEQPGTAGAATWLQRGRNELKGRRLLEAVDAFRRAVEIEPLHAVAQMLLGIALQQAADPQSAVHALRGALVLEPHLWPATFYLALSYGDLGRVDEARATYRWLCELLRQPARPQTEAWVEDFEAWRDEVSVLAAARAGRRGAPAS